MDMYEKYLYGRMIDRMVVDELKDDYKEALTTDQQEEQ